MIERAIDKAAFPPAGRERQRDQPKRLDGCENAGLNQRARVVRPSLRCNISPSALMTQSSGAQVALAVWD